ncbi:MAG: hypothetical protein ACLUW6_07805 [Coriobacteriaceae bacterium]
MPITLCSPRWTAGVLRTSRTGASYYRERLLSERPASDSAEEQARSALRKRFYAYAISELREAFVHETADSFSASFPRFPRNTEQMRATRLYTEPVYPVTVDGELPVMHAWDGCPEAGLVDYYGSAEEWESGSFRNLPCLQVHSERLRIGGSASTSIDNGFEYHYDAVAQAAADYQKARADAEPLSRAAKGKRRAFGRGSGRARRCGRLPHQSGSLPSGRVHRLRRLDGRRRRPPSRALLRPRALWALGPRCRRRRSSGTRARRRR